METKVESGEEGKYATQAKLYRNKETLGELIYRNNNSEHKDYATWPLQLIAPKTKRGTKNEETYGEREDRYEVRKRTWNALIQMREDTEGEGQREEESIKWKEIRDIIRQIEETPGGEQLKIYRIGIALCGSEDLASNPSG